MKIYNSPDMQVIRLITNIVTTSAPNTVNGSVGGNPVSPGDMGAPGRRRIWD